MGRPNDHGVTSASFPDGLWEAVFLSDRIVEVDLVPPNAVAPQTSSISVGGKQCVVCRLTEAGPLTDELSDALLISRRGLEVSWN